MQGSDWFEPDFSLRFAHQSIQRLDLIKCLLAHTKYSSTSTKASQAVQDRSTRPREEQERRRKLAPTLIYRVFYTIFEPQTPLKNKSPDTLSNPIKLAKGEVYESPGIQCQVASKPLRIREL